MTTHASTEVRSDPSIWKDFARPLPDWFQQAKLGIFIHWGAYSVPAWAEPIGALGTIPGERWFAHNPYAEWYYNTIRIEDSPAARHHQEVHGGVPYDTFLDEWDAGDFDAHDWARLFRDVGADYVVPTTKHHDGIALWDAPGTGARNTVHRGPRRDLVAELADATRAAGLRFGVYYSGGLDWSVTDLPPHTSSASVRGVRPLDAAYNAYAYLHVEDLIERYQPDVLWNDIEWPDAGKRTGRYSLHELFTRYYDAVPHGVVNDRWGDTHWDFRTSEYEAGREHETADAWQNCRGIGFSFGHNAVEGPDEMLSGHELARHLADVVSRGGQLLLNVGPTAAGTIPEIQQESLQGLGRWTAQLGESLRASTPVPEDVARPSDEPWVRWLDTPAALVALVDQPGRIDQPVADVGLDRDRASFLSGSGTVESGDEGVVVEVERTTDGPAAVTIPRR
jgi:alpha-L-fucosidase